MRYTQEEIGKMLNEAGKQAAADMMMLSGHKSNKEFFERLYTVYMKSLILQKTVMFNFQKNGFSKENIELVMEEMEAIVESAGIEAIPMRVDSHETMV